MSSVIRATDWRVATVARIAPETPRAATLTLDIPGWEGHRPGQHIDVRLNAEDGYQAQRRYSIASAPGRRPRDHGRRGRRRRGLTVDGPSPREEDLFEVRGPFGGWFVWEGSTGRCFFIGGGSGWCR